MIYNLEHPVCYYKPCNSSGFEKDPRNRKDFPNPWPRALTSCRRMSAPSDRHCIPSVNHQPSLPEYWLIPEKVGHTPRLHILWTLLLPPAILSWIRQRWSSREGKATPNQEEAQIYPWTHQRRGVVLPQPGINRIVIRCLDTTPDTPQTQISARTPRTHLIYHPSSWSHGSWHQGRPSQDCTQGLAALLGLLLLANTFNAGLKNE